MTAITGTKNIVRDTQGLTGVKVDIYALPYTAINMRSSENAGKFDLDAELELWTRAGRVKIRWVRKWAFAVSTRGSLIRSADRKN